MRHESAPSLVAESATEKAQPSAFRTKPWATLKAHVHTITSDNGGEFAGHEAVSEAFEADFFFAHPYSSWERGLNENTNGLVRQYLKKGSAFNHVTDDELAIVAAKLNFRPRKTLGYKSPNELVMLHKE